MENLKGRDLLEGLGRGERVILKQILGFGGVDGVYVAQDRDWWWAVVNTVMNLWVL
jgi:hypothetical protein